MNMKYPFGSNKGLVLVTNTIVKKAKHVEFVY